MSNIWENTPQNKKKTKKIDERYVQNMEEGRLEKYVVLYRVSTDRQAKEGDSLEMQARLAKRFVAENGGILINEYYEDGVSAYKNFAWERPKLMELLDDIKNGIANHVVVFSRDRLARDVDSARYVYGILRECHARITFTNPKEPALDVQAIDFATEMMETLYYASNNNESKKTSERVANTMYTIALEGRITGGVAPIGYETVYKKGRTPHFVPVEWFKPTIKIIEDLYFNGYGLKTIARWLNGGEVKGLDTLAAPKKKPINNDKTYENWNEKNIETILFSPIYTGYTHFNPYAIDEEKVIQKSPYIEAIRDEETQLRLNNLRKLKGANKSNTKKFNTPFLLTGILRCQSCGALYKTMSSQRSDGAVHSYYKCKNRHSSKKEACKSMSFRKEVIEGFIKKHVFAILESVFTSKTFELSLKLENEKDNLKNEQAEIIREKLSVNNKKLENYMRLLGELDIDSPTYEMMKTNYENAVAKLTMEDVDLKRTLSELEVEGNDKLERELSFNAFMNSLEKFNGLFDTMSVSMLKQTIDKLFSDISVDAEGNVTMVLAVNIDVQKDTGEKSSVISPTTMREGMLVENIKDSIREFTYSFNYYNAINNLKAFIHKHLFEFLSKHDEKLVDITLHEIPHRVFSEKTSYTQRDVITLNTYIERKLGITRSVRTALKNGQSIGYSSFERVLKKTSLTVSDYCSYLNKKFNASLNDEMLIESVRGIQGIHPEDKYLDKLECGECGSKLKLGKKYKETRGYLCVRSRVDYKDRCFSRYTNSRYLDDYFKINNIDITSVSKIVVKSGIVAELEYVK